MSFDFVPRSVKKRRIKSEVSTSLNTGDKNLGPTHQEGRGPPKIENSITKSSSISAYALSSSTSVVKSKDSPEPDLEQLAGLVWLSLSNYAIWADTDLRRKIDWNSDVRGHNDQEQDNANDKSNEGCGYIPLAYLFQRSPVFIQASSSASFVHHPETIYVKALRTHATQLIDVRLVLSSEESDFSHAANRKWSSSSGTQTGYEVRVKPQMKTDGKGLNECGKADWDRLTIYVENIPVQYRNLPGTIKFLTTLLSSSPPEAPYSKIQNIAFPPHHRDQPNSIPICKGFALITLSSLQEANFLLEKWPWHTTSKKHCPKEQDVDTTYSHMLQDAVKFGFRTISKERWEGLKAEYLLFRQQLVEEINDFQENERNTRRHAHGASSTFKPGPSIEHSQDHGRNITPSESGHTLNAAASRRASLIHATSSYPSGCLVFMRNLHSETNKTTLRAVFTHAWKSNNGKPSTSKSDDGIDYLDYMKGMDSCHIRLSTPLHAQQFVEYFSTHPTIQSSGLDSIGSPLESSQSSSKPIVPELVLGKREEVYWEKVPEKIRKQAVDKALKLMDDRAQGERDVDDGKMSIGTVNGYMKRRGR